MAIELGWLSREEVGFSQVESIPLEPSQIRVRTVLGRIRHGADLKPPSSSLDLPRPFRSWGVADILEIGKSVTRFQPGDRIYGPMFQADRQVVEESHVLAMNRFSNRIEFSTFIDAGAAALRAIHAAEIRYGDRIGIWGMGTVGLMAVQYARLSGAREIIAVDPLENRRKLAQKLGAHRVEEPGANRDFQLDAAVDCTGSREAWREAAVFVKSNGRLVTNVGTDSSESNDSITQCYRQAGIRVCRLDESGDVFGLTECVQSSIEIKHVIVWPIITHTVAFERSPETCQLIREQPNEYVQVLLTYP